VTGAASDTLTEPAVERLRQRCEALRRLTTANNAALDLIADLQSKGSGEFVFDVAYLRAICDRAVALGQEAVDAVTGLTGSPERQLEAALARLRAGLEDALGERTALPDGPWLATLDSASDLPEVLTGKKVRHLSLVRRQARLPVPDGYVITAAACQALLAANGLWPAIHWDISRIPVVDRKALMGKSAEIQAGVRAAAWPQELADAVCAAFDDLARRSATAALRVSVRSSAFDQDGDFSFAGQFESVLNVDRAGLLDACLRVLASQFGFRAVIYYKRLGSDAALRPMAIGVVRMVNAQSSGVLYTRVPDQPSDEMMLLSGTWGLGPSTVGGTVAPDVFLVSRSQPFAVLDAQIGAKTSMQLPGPSSGLVETEVPGWMQRTSCLTRDQASLLASYGRRLEDHGGTPQDIEWAVDADDHVIVLQSRPLVLRPAAGADVAALRTGLRPLLSGGIRTSRGVGAGPVELVDQPPLRHDIPPGRVIVSGAAAPELSAVLERASALVTETGAVASHLATVARELGVPALFGVRQAREVLRAGQLVTVDAEFGDIFDGRIEALVSAAAGRHADEPPPDTPLGRKLAAVHAALVPLNLVAPRAPTFKPSACRTLHDILRYAHEKAVRELLRAGRGRPAALPLESPMPVNFYVLDLGRAVGTAPDAASVRPEQVASRPFTALWRGMSQIPWNRAPAGGVGGLAQLMARQMTSANRSAEAAAPNYVMVTPSYLNMTFRLGYHVSTVDAYLAQRARDNYASLVFQGGAADAAGRSRRLDFVAAILADRGWQTARRSDALFARTDALSPAVLTGELETLGRLLVVTRQTDVAFDTDERTREAVAAFKAGDLSLGLGA
jgi:pyruvate,water dikinase